MPHPAGQILARWRGELHGAACSPLEFFERVWEAMEGTGFPDVRFSEVRRREGGALSAERIYFRIRSGQMFFDVSSFVAGSTLVVGYWLHVDDPGLFELFSEIPGLGRLLEHVVRPATYYRVDLSQSFQYAVHDSILHAMDELSERNGIDLLPEIDRHPVWNEVW
jgi:hypothetical protein